MISLVSVFQLQVRCCSRPDDFVSNGSYIQDFRQCQSIVQKVVETPHTFPPSAAGSSRNEILAAQNVQKALAANVQDLSSIFRKKQRVYMQSKPSHHSFIPIVLLRIRTSYLSCAHYLHYFSPIELQGHAIKNQDLLIASGTTHIKGSESITAVEEDMEFVSPPHLA